MEGVTLAGKQWRIVVPAIPVQLDIILAMGENRPRCAAAALALCLHDENGKRYAPRLSYKACGCNPLSFGGLVVAHLHAAKIPLGEWYEAGLACLAAISTAYEFVGMPSADEVAGAEDFTEAPRAPTTSSGSPSPSSTDPAP